MLPQGSPRIYRVTDGTNTTDRVGGEARTPIAGRSRPKPTRTPTQFLADRCGLTLATAPIGLDFRSLPTYPLLRLFSPFSDT